MLAGCYGRERERQEAQPSAVSPPCGALPQIGKEIKRFAKAVGLACTCVYGGSGVANQITELKRGTEIVVCTPGRMIDILGEGFRGLGGRDQMVWAPAELPSLGPWHGAAQGRLLGCRIASTA